MKFLLTLTITLLLLTGCNGNNNNKINYQPDLNKNTEITPPAASANVYGTYSTKITDKTDSRLNNIQLGVQKLNGATIEPGQEFSFNDRLGPRNDDTGFEKAIIFDGHGNKIKGYGGGLCQISSTLYNAVLDAGLEVTERHEHSHEVPYIEQGKDATVSYNAEDFKFKNTSDRTIKISATTDNDLLTVTISNN